MELTRLFDLIPYQIQKFNKEIAFSRKEEGVWKTYSSKEVQDIIDELSLGFLAQGIQAGEKVAIISENRPEWNFVDMGLAQTGIIHVPVFTTLNEKRYNEIFEHAGIKAVFVSNKEPLEYQQTFYFLYSPIVKRFSRNVREKTFSLFY